MKTLKNTFLVALLVAGASLFAQEYQIDAGKSSVKWTGKKVTGEHTGNINLKSGEFTIEKNKIISGVFVIDMTTITNTDLEGEWHDKLVGHLNSDDFFGTSSFPTAKLEVTESSKFKAGVSSVKGNLTIKGKTHPVSFDVKQDGEIFTASVSVDRTLYDIKYGSGKFFDDLGDKMIDDTFLLEIKLISK